METIIHSTHFRVAYVLILFILNSLQVLHSALWFLNMKQRWQVCFKLLCRCVKKRKNLHRKCIAFRHFSTSSVRSFTAAVEFSNECRKWSNPWVPSGTLSIEDTLFMAQICTISRPANGHFCGCRVVEKIRFSTPNWADGKMLKLELMMDSHLALISGSSFVKDFKSSF